MPKRNDQQDNVTSRNEDNPQHIFWRRVTDSYIQAKSLGLSVPIGNHWNSFLPQTSINSRYLSPALLRRFRSMDTERLSLGFDDHNSTEETVVALVDLLVQHASEGVNPLDLMEFSIGNPPTISIGPVTANYHDLFLVSYALHISRFVSAPQVILEIGPGFGGLAHKLKILYPSATVLLIDLPETSVCTSYYLHQLHPEASFILTSDISESSSNKTDSAIDFKSADFVILPPTLIDLIPSGTVDLAINTRSFMEMPLSVVSTYFTHIQRLVKIDGYFFCANRYFKC